MSKPDVSYYIQESIYSCESTDWQCYVDKADCRCLRVVNKNFLSLPDVTPDSIGVCKLDTGVRTAVPLHYAIILLGIEPRYHTQREVKSSLQERCFNEIRYTTNGSTFTFPQIANGVIDSGYRGTVSLIVYYDKKSRHLDPGSLCVRFGLIKLSTVYPNARMLFSLYEAGSDYECGFKFVTSIRTVCNSDAVDGELQPPPDGKDVWDGTTCSALAVIRNESVCVSTHYRTDDPRVSFVVQTCDMAVVGVRLHDQKNQLPIGPLYFFSSGEIATLLPFSETFRCKRNEDAGYDIFSPLHTVLEPMTITPITIKQRYICPNGSILPCIYGRSSMNLKGILVIPTRWKNNEWLTIHLCNTTRKPVCIETGDRIAQLILLSRESNVWLPCSPNSMDPFPKSKDTQYNYDINDTNSPKWRLSNNFENDSFPSERSSSGFGSTGV